MKRILLILAMLNFICQSQTSLHCYVYGNPSNVFEASNTKFLVNESLFGGEYNACGTSPAIIVAVIEPSLSFEECLTWGTYYESDSVIYNIEHNFGNSNNNGGCRARVENHFVFYQDDHVQMDSLISLLKTKIPNAAHVLVYSWYNLDPETIEELSPELIDTFHELGWTDFNYDLGNIPFILYSEIGSPLFAQSIYGVDAEDEVSLDIDFECDLISYSDTIGVDEPSDDDSTVTDLGFKDNVLDFKFFCDEQTIFIKGVEAGQLEVLNLHTLQGKEISFTTIVNTNSIQIFPLEEIPNYVIISLMNMEGSPIRKLVTKL
ncbi:hypothetical protein [Crocinitomix algicola]|uniref:hypothetical protein n=1 Tax=Crocinitomix algicola TaxID=1740263 RepID=UPI000871CFF8|nr:hypothetical protein [Crocinitomix algicola]